MYIAEESCVPYMHAHCIHQRVLCMLIVNRVNADERFRVGTRHSSSHHDELPLPRALINFNIGARIV